MELLQIIVDGVVISSVYLLVALGVTIVFGLTRLINFAHGEFVVLGAFVSYECVHMGWPLWVAVISGLVLTTLLALVLERVLFRRTLRNPLSGMILGLGILVVMQQAIASIWGSNDVSLSISGGWHFGGIELARSWGVIIALTVVCTVALLLVLNFSSLGLRMRATQADPLAAGHAGINPARMISIAFAIGSAMAALAGAAYSTIIPVGPFDGGTIVITGFCVALLGGLGNVVGAIGSALVFGIGESLIAAYISPEWVSVWTTGLVIVVLLVRPGGLLDSGPVHAEEAPIVHSRPEVWSSRSRSRFRSMGGKAVLWLAACLVAFELVPTFEAKDQLTVAMIYAIVAVAVGFLYNYQGVLSFAHAALMALGGYTAALLEIHLGLDLWEALIPAFVVGCLGGLMIGWPCARVKGHYGLLLTLAYGLTVVTIITNISSLTGGDDGIQVLTGPGNIGPVNVRGGFAYYTTVVVVLFVVIGAALLVLRSEVGYRIIAIRENEPLARAMGLNTVRYKAMTFSLSGGVAAVGGALYLYQEFIITPDSFDLLAGVSLVVMVVVGGRSMASGAVLGAVLVTFGPQLFNLSPAATQISYGLLLCVVVVLFPLGVVPTVMRLADWTKGRLTAGDHSHWITSVGRAKEGSSI